MSAAMAFRCCVWLAAAANGFVAVLAFDFASILQHHNEPILDLLGAVTWFIAGAALANALGWAAINIATKPLRHPDNPKAVAPAERLL